jgi:hypothetical protein
MDISSIDNIQPPLHQYTHSMRVLVPPAPHTEAVDIHLYYPLVGPYPSYGATLSIEVEIPAYIVAVSLWYDHGQLVDYDHPPLKMEAVHLNEPPSATVSTFTLKVVQGYKLIACSISIVSIQQKLVTMNYISSPSQQQSQ